MHGFNEAAQESHNSKAKFSSKSVPSGIIEKGITCIKHSKWDMTKLCSRFYEPYRKICIITYTEYITIKDLK